MKPVVFSEDKKPADLTDVELVGVYTRAVRKSWEDFLAGKVKSPSRNGKWQRENKLKKELLKRLGVEPIQRRRKK